jgi:hypothetical protein
MSRVTSRLPDFLVIGAQKAGTTALHAHLASHPRLLGSARKELHYFDRDYKRPVTWYAARFPDSGEGLRFESTPEYLFLPYVPARVAHVLPGARFVVLLREPVARAVSHYQMEVRREKEPLPFADALAAEAGRLADMPGTPWALRPGRAPHALARLLDLPRHGLAGPMPARLRWIRYSYRARGLYAEQLGRWFAHFPRDRFFITTSETLWRDPAATVGRLLDWLGVEGMPAEPFRAAFQGNYTPPTGPAIDALRESFREPNERLCELLGWRPEWAQEPSA